jgi:hypothetical protein
MSVGCLRDSDGYGVNETMISQKGLRLDYTVLTNRSKRRRAELNPIFYRRRPFQTDVTESLGGSGSTGHRQHPLLDDKEVLQIFLPRTSVSFISTLCMMFKMVQ